MPLYVDWSTESENGARFIETTNNPINSANGLYSLLAQSDGTEWDVIFPGFRKSASVYLKETYPRGFSDGRIRTLIRRNSADQGVAWSGIFIMSDRIGIGTRLDPGQNRYEISDEDGTIKVIKVTNAIKSTLFDTGVNFTQDVVYGLNVDWEYDVILDRMLIRVMLGTNLDFSDLTLIGALFDFDPHQFSTSEGLFFQAESSSDFVSYNYDTTSIFRVTHI